jgi:hypothetical protein
MKGKKRWRNMSTMQMFRYSVVLALFSAILLKIVTEVDIQNVYLKNILIGICVLGLLSCVVAGTIARWEIGSDLNKKYSLTKFKKK